MWLLLGAFHNVLVFLGAISRCLSINIWYSLESLDNSYPGLRVLKRGQGTGQPCMSFDPTFTTGIPRDCGVIQNKQCNFSNVLISGQNPTTTERWRCMQCLVIRILINDQSPLGLATIQGSHYAVIGLGLGNSYFATPMIRFIKLGTN